MGEFSENVYEVVRRIPRGKVSTYGDIARAVGRPRAARFVGYALHDNPDTPEVTPCHRVVFKDGRLASGYVFGGPDVQKRRLEDEGVTFTDAEHVDMAKHRWVPGVVGTELPDGIDWEAEMAE